MAPGQESTAAGNPLVVAVSGGPDSVALLHIIARRGIYPREQVIVGHLDHGIRPEAAADATFVADLARNWGLHYRGGEADVPELASHEGLSLEAAARQARYDFLAATARATGATAIVTGHNQRDQAETVLMHLLRGSGVTGLRGMRPVTQLPGAPDIQLLRPLLSVDRGVIEAYCRENRLGFVQDDSNLDTRLFRNRLRHELLPGLEEYNRSIVSHLYNLASVVDAEDELLDQLLAKMWPEVVLPTDEERIGLDLARWRAWPLALRRRSLRHATLSLKPDSTELGFEATELARKVAETGQSGDQVNLPGGLELSVQYGQLVLMGAGESVSTDAWPQMADDSELALSVPGRLDLPAGWVFSAQRVEGIPFDTVAANQDLWRAYVRVGFSHELRVRPRRAGERIRPLGMGGRSTKIGDVMTNRKIPAAARPLWPILTCRDHLLWLPGHLLDERARIEPGDNEAILLQVERRRGASEGGASSRSSSASS
jgi:tRNA(Ile)-lysidine synthase